MDPIVQPLPLPSDAPISSLADDRLERRKFSVSLARRLLVGAGEESTVIGLFGPWGSGKSSIINMALSALKDEVAGSGHLETEPIVVRFNPWYFGDQERLMSLFFDQLLLSIIGKADKGLEGLKDFIGKYGRYLSVFEPIPVAGDVAKGLANLTELAARQESLEQIRKKLNGEFRELGRRIIIVVDDVDRLTQAQIRQLFPDHQA